MTYTEFHKTMALELSERIMEKGGNADDAISISELMIAAFLLETAKLKPNDAKVKSLHSVHHIICCIDLLTEASQDYIKGMH
jgi:hypothetical protein